MEWIPLKELCAELGIVQARIVRAWKTNDQIDGKSIESVQENGERLWRVVEPKHALEDSPAHGRTVNALADAGLLYAEDVAEFVGDVDDETAVSLLTKLDGVGQKGAGDVVGWLADLGLRSEGAPEKPERNATDGELVHTEYDLSKDSEPGQCSDEPESPSPEPGEESGTLPTGEGEEGIATFGRLAEGDVFPSRYKGQVARFRKIEPGRHDHETFPDLYEPGQTGAPYNAEYLDGQFRGRKCFFTDDHEIVDPWPPETHVERNEKFVSEEPADVEDGEPDTPSTKAPLHERFNAWLSETFESTSRSRGLDTFDDEVLREVRQRIHRAAGRTFTFDNIHQFRLGHDMPLALRTGVEKILDGSDDEIDFTFDDVHPGPSYPPCKCEAPSLPDGESGWVQCEGAGCGGYVRIEEHPEQPDEEVRDLIEASAHADEVFSAEELEAAAAKQDAATEPPEVATEGDSTAPAVVWPDEEETVVVPDHVPGRHPAPVELVPRDERLHFALTSCRALGTFEPDSERWHAARARGVGSSDAGAVIGVSPHAKPIDVWRSKTGEPERARPWLDVYSDFGTWFEPYLRDHCEFVSGVSIWDGGELGTLQSVRWPHALANIDGLDEFNGVIEELKTTSEKWTVIPEAYVAQVQHQMFVTGAEEARIRQFISPIRREHAMSLLASLRAFESIPSDNLLAEWLLAEGEVVTWIVERDEQYIERLVDREKTFWTFVEAEIEPPEVDPDGTVDLTDDPDVYASVVEYANLAAQAAPYKVQKKIADGAKKKARKAIERAIALLEEEPKRVTIADHKATLVVRDTHSYWNIYPQGAADDGIIF